MLVPKAAINLYNFFLNTPKTKAGISLNQVHTEFSVTDNGLEEEQLDRQNRFCTFAVKMLIIGKLYIALTSKDFKQYIWDWLRSIHDCYFLQSKLLNESFETFDFQNVLQVVHDNNKERKAQKMQKIPPQKIEKWYYTNGSRGFEDQIDFKPDESNKRNSSKTVSISSLLRVL